MREYLAIGAALLALTLPACNNGSSTPASSSSSGIYFTTNIGFINADGSANIAPDLPLFTATPSSGPLSSFAIVLSEGIAPLVNGKATVYKGAFTVTPAANNVACISIAPIAPTPPAPQTAFTVTETCTASANGVFNVSDTLGNTVQMDVNYIQQT